MRACLPLLAALALAALPVSGCRDQPHPPATGPARPPFALLPVQGTSPAAPLAPTVDALPPASSPLTVALAEGPERYRLIDQALAASEAFAASPPDYVVRDNGTPVSVWRSHNGWIRAVERLATGERAYFYRALTEQPYLVAGPGAAYGYDRGELAAAYDRDGVALGGLAASLRVVAAARLLDRGRALHRAIVQGKRTPAHAGDWRLASAAVDDQRLRWRQSLGQRLDWRDWHEDQTGDRESRWAAERRQRLAYAAMLGAMPKPKPSQHRKAGPAVALAAAPVKAAAPPPPAVPATPIETSRSAVPPAAGAKPRAARQDDRPRKRAITAKAKRKPARSRKHLRRHSYQRAAAEPARIEKPGRIEETARDERPAEAKRRHRTPKFLRDVGKFFDRTFGGSGVRVHRNSEPPEEE
jgi:hypothetical protein